MYDVIVIGARAAGSPTAMLLARRGLRVLLVDRASFPSDTLSTHLVQLKGAAALKRWGLLERVLDTNCPTIHTLSFQQGRYRLHGEYFPLEGLKASVCPRRTVLDKILVDAAVEAGVEFREDVIVEELLSDSSRITGIRGRLKSKGEGTEMKMTEKARLVIGADGKHSMVAKTVNANEYQAEPGRSCAYYSYWEGIHLEGGELYTLENAVVGFFPTNDGQAVLFTGYPAHEFDSIRRDVEGYFWKTMQAIPGMTDKLRSGQQAGRFLGTADLPNFYRHPYGEGWALVGDAGMTMDPITGQGIGNAFRDAERLAQAVEKGLSGQEPIEKAMALYERDRNSETLPMYKFTVQIGAFEPISLQQEVLYTALEKKPANMERFFGMLAGSVPVKEFFSTASLFRMIGIGGMSKIAFRGRKNSQSERVADAELDAG